MRIICFFEGSFPDRQRCTTETIFLPTFCIIFLHVSENAECKKAKFQKRIIWVKATTELNSRFRSRVIVLASYEKRATDSQTNGRNFFFHFFRLGLFH